MTWSKTVTQTTGVLAHRIGHNAETKRVQIRIGFDHANLTAEEAASLGGYLMEKAKEIESE